MLTNLIQECWVAVTSNCSDFLLRVGGGELFNGLLPLDEEALEGGDALLQPVHGDLAAAAGGQGRRQLGHVRVQLVPAHAQGLSLGLNQSLISLWNVCTMNRGDIFHEQDFNISYQAKHTWVSASPCLISLYFSSAMSSLSPSSSLYSASRSGSGNCSASSLRPLDFASSWPMRREHYTSWPMRGKCVANVYLAGLHPGTRLLHQHQHPLLHAVEHVLEGCDGLHGVTMSRCHDRVRTECGVTRDTRGWLRPVTSGAGVMGWHAGVTSAGRGRGHHRREEFIFIRFRWIRE